MLHNVTLPHSGVMFILFLCPKCSSDPTAYKILHNLTPSPSPAQFFPLSPPRSVSFTLFSKLLFALHDPVLLMFPFNGTFLYHFLHFSLYSGLFSKVTSSGRTFPPPYGEIRQHSSNSQVLYFALTFKRSCMMHLLFQWLIFSPPPECKLLRGQIHFSLLFTAVSTELKALPGRFKAQKIQDLLTE